MEVEFCERLWLTQNVLQAQRRIRMSENGDPGVQSEVRNANELNFVGFCRIFSGTMKKGCHVFVLGLKWICFELLSNCFMERTKVRPVQSEQILCQSRSPATVSFVSWACFSSHVGRKIFADGSCAGELGERWSWKRVWSWRNIAFGAEDGDIE